MLGVLGRRYRVGGLYSVVVDDRGYAVARVLATEWRAVHVRVYSNRYRERPRAVDRSTLFLAASRDFAAMALNATTPEERPDPGAFAIGHLPLRLASFAAWKPRLMSVTKVDDDELAGYRAWRAESGGRF